MIKTIKLNSIFTLNLELLDKPIISIYLDISDLAIAISWFSVNLNWKPNKEEDNESNTG